MTEEQPLYWADRIVEQIKKRLQENDTLRKQVAKRGIIVYDEKTPSGRIHIGSGRGWVIHDIIAKALRAQGLPGRFILSSDDMDPMDDLPPYLDEQKYRPYMGVPFRNIPWSENETFAQHFFNDVTSKFPDYGIEAELESTGQHYINGDFNPMIKILLDNTDQVQAIHREMYGDKVAAAFKLPFNPICEKCGKIGTTLATHWDSESELLTYECRSDLVKWARGCGHKGTISPYNGGGKFPWKLEWSAKWPMIGVVYETAGKDHFSAGGSRDVAIRIANRILHYPPPLPSEGEVAGPCYEFFIVGGLKMSSSKGKGVAFSEMLAYAPGYILRYILARSHPTSAIDFQVEGTNHLLLYYDQYDQTERIYYDQETLPDPRDIASQKRLYEAAHVGPIRSEMPLQLSFKLALDISQVTTTDDGAMERLKTLGKIPATISTDDYEYLKQRIAYARNWAPHAPEELCFTVVTEPKITFPITEMERKALHEFITLVLHEIDEEKIKDGMGTIMKAYNVKPNQLFKIIYQIVFGKPKGPRLIPFILTFGNKNFAELLQKALTSSN